MVKSIAHIGFSVKDLKESISFYCDILGFEEIDRKEFSGKYLDNILAGKNVELDAVFLQAQDKSSIIELLDFKKPKNSYGDDVPFFQTGLNHFCVSVGNIDSIYEKLLANNYKLNSPPLLSPDKKVKICFVREPNGIMVELIEHISE